MIAGTLSPAVGRHDLPSAAGAVTRLAGRQLRRGTVLVTAVCAGMSALVAVQYRASFQGEMSQRAVQVLAENPAIRVLFGPPVALDDPGGFTVWRTGTPVLLLAGVWLMVAAVRVTRGEEDAGRWDLLLAGRARPVDVVLRYAAAVAVVAIAIGTAVGAALVFAGTGVTGAIVYGAGVCGVTATFGAAGLAAAQVMPTRASATAVAVGTVGVALLLRMVADGVDGLAFAGWLTPLGVIAHAAPYAGNRLPPLAVLAAFALLTALAAVAAAHLRDVGGGLVSVRARRAARTRLLGSVAGFALRRAVRPTLGWAAGIAAYFVIIGAMLASILEFFDQNPRFADLAAGAGFAGLGSADGFAAALLLLLAIPTGLYAATRLAAVVADERAQRWTVVFAAPVPRGRLLGTEIAVTAAGVLVLHLVAAVAMWAGARVTGAPLGVPDAVAGAVNTAPVALLAVGAAALAVGVAPGAVTAAGALPVVGGFLLDVVADSVGAPAWVSGLSPFAHVAATPEAPPAWTAIVVFVALSAGAACAGVAGYRRRDLST